MSDRRPTHKSISSRQFRGLGTSRRSYKFSKEGKKAYTKNRKQNALKFLSEAVLEIEFKYKKFTHSKVNFFFLIIKASQQ